MQLEAEYFVRLVNNQQHVFTTPIKEEDFESPAFRAGLAELKRQIRADTIPDMATIGIALPQYSGELFAANSASRSSYEIYEKKFIDAIQERRLYRAVNNIGSRLGRDEPISEILRDAIDMITGCAVNTTSRSIMSLYDCAVEFGPVLEERYNERGKIPGITTGFKQLDETIGGFQPQIYFIGARPSQGKTALLLSMMRSALKSGYTAAMLSLESSQQSIIERVLSADADIPMRRIRTGSLEIGDFKLLEKTFGTMEKWNGYLEFNPSSDISEIERSCHAYVKGHDVKIIFIDYLQRISAPGRTKIEEVANASRRLTNLSRELNIPIVCMAQTGRQADHEPPEISHFQHSSQIEQDADVAIIIRHIWSCECGKPDCTEDQRCNNAKCKSTLVILKNRDGDTGEIPVIFDRDYVKFV